MHFIDRNSFSDLPAFGRAVVLASFAAFTSAAAIALEASAPDENEATTTVLQEIIVTAPEPRYVAPTRRDRIGRIWAPVFINEKGPFRLVLDTGASHSGITESVASALGIVPNQADQVTLRGVTGSATVATIRVNSLVVGDMELRGRRLPIITDPLGGAQGILGSEGLADKRIYIDFRNDFIRINRSRGERAPSDFVTIPVTFTRGRLLTIDARIGNVPVKAIVDTGAEVTVANMAARNALFRYGQTATLIDKIEGATNEIQIGEGFITPPLVIGGIVIRSNRTTFLDLHIFKHWKMTEEPAILIGMDALGLLDTLIIDYKRAELHMKTRS